MTCRETRKTRSNRRVSTELECLRSRNLQSILSRGAFSTSLLVAKRAPPPLLLPAVHPPGAGQTDCGPYHITVWGGSECVSRLNQDVSASPSSLYRKLEELGIRP
jgi:hypothetical protein